MRQSFLIENFDMKQPKIKLNLHEPQVMGILNITPDSFYSASRNFTSEEVEIRVREMICQGATIIDIGGYSSRPNAEDVSEEEEWRRIDLGLSALRRVAPEVAVSLDTFRSYVAQRALNKYGWLIINDISAGEMDARLIDIVAEYQVPYIAMHMRGTPQTMQDHAVYDSVVEDVINYFNGKIQQLKYCGITDIILDPGFGFAKNVEQNYALLSSLNKLCELGYPVLAGISRKSMIYKPLGVEASEALAGTIALNWEALRQGATLIRVHDVREASDIVKIYKKFLG